MDSRPATHAGSWYSSNKTTLSNQLNKFFSANEFDTIKGARLLIGPHAGFTFSGARLAETFAVWDSKDCERIFILGPSHHIYFRNQAMISAYDCYETPVGPILVDTDVNQYLSKIKSDKGAPLFPYMSEEADQDEHSFEMHCPFIRYKLDLQNKGSNPGPKIVPIMISSMDSHTSDQVVASLLPYFQDPKNTFVISSDFCHWGSRFGYTEYVPEKVDLSAVINVNDLNIKTLSSFSKLSSSENAIFESIETLDKIAMQVASKGSYKDWEKYIKTTGNTICGQKPVYLMLKLLSAASCPARFKWLGYSQSSAVENYFDSSVSYASGYVVRDV